MVLVRVMLAAHFPVHALVTVACVTLYDVESRTPPDIIRGQTKWVLYIAKTKVCS